MIRLYSLFSVKAMQPCERARAQPIESMVLEVGVKASVRYGSCLDGRLRIDGKVEKRG